MGSLRLAILASIRDAHEGPQPPQSPGKVDRKRKKDDTARVLLNGHDAHSPGAGRGRKKKPRESDDQNEIVKVKEEKATERPTTERGEQTPDDYKPQPPEAQPPAEALNGDVEKIEETVKDVSSPPPPPPPPPAEDDDAVAKLAENDDRTPPPPPSEKVEEVCAAVAQEPLIEEVHVVEKVVTEAAVVSSEPSPSADDEAPEPPRSPRPAAKEDLLLPPLPPPTKFLQKQVSTASSMSEAPASEDGPTPTTKKKRKRNRQTGDVTPASGERRPGRAAAKEATRRILNRQYATEEEKALGGAVRCDRCRKRRQLPPSLKAADLPEKWYCEMNTWNLAEASCDAPEAKRTKSGRSTPASAKSLSRQQSLADDLAISADEIGNGTATTAESLAAAAARGAATFDAAPLSGNEGPILSSLTAAASLTVGKEENAPLFEWAQCDRCQKWRRLPGVVDVSQLPEKWYCEMNEWDSLRQSCDAPEEVEDEETLAQQQAAAAQANNNSNNGSSSSRRGAPTAAKSGGEGHHHRGRPPGGKSGGGSAKKSKQPLSHQHSTSSSATVEVASEKRGGSATGKRAKPVWNWVQCERKTCRKWRRLPPDISPESLPDRWLCSMNTWDTRFASCAADEEDVEEIEDESAAGPTVAPLPRNRFAKKENKLSYRELIFTAEGKLRPPFSERSSVTSIFSVGTRLVNGKLHDVEAYADSEYYDPRGRDYNVYNATTGRAANRGLLS